MSLLYRFGTDERGSVTVWNIVWFLVFVIFAGIGIDTANGYRIKTMLQHTADASAHAGVISLPDEADAEATAQTFAATNMPESLHGIPVPASNVEVGFWDPVGGFTPGTGTGVNAVKVSAARTESQQNALGTQLLQVIGVDFFDINAEAVAASGINDCLTDGIVAGGMVDLESNNDVLEEFCFHGQGKDGVGINLNNNNQFLCGTRVSMPNLAEHFKSPESSLFVGMEHYNKSCEPGDVPTAIDGSSNDGLYEALRVRNLTTLGVEICQHLNIVLGFVKPGYGDDTDWRTYTRSDGVIEKCLVNNQFQDFEDTRFRVTPEWMDDPSFASYVTYKENGDFEALDLADTSNQNKLYYVNCSAKGGKNGTLELEGIIENVAIITNCRVDGKKVKVNGTLADDTSAKKLELSNVLLMSTATGQSKKDPENFNTVTFPGGAKIGTAVCATDANGKLTGGTEADGSVHIYSLGSIKFPSDGQMNGAQIVTEGSVKMAAQAGVNGVNVLAAEDVLFTSNSKLGDCPAGTAAAAYTTRDVRVVF